MFVSMLFPYSVCGGFTPLQSRLIFCVRQPGPDTAYHAVLARKVLYDSYFIKARLTQKLTDSLSLVIANFQVNSSPRL